MQSPVRLTVCCLPAVLAIACAPDAPNLANRVFVSQSVTEGGAERVLVDGTQLQLRFHESPRVGASAGCNSMDATYSIDDDTFVLSGMGITEIGCDQARHEQDDWYFGFLGSSPSIQVDGDTIVLSRDGTRIEYLDQEVATPDFTLAGHTWTVETIIEGEAAIGGNWPNPATLRFEADGTVEVETGCNSGTGTYRVEGTALTFADVAVTERGCIDQAAQQLEAGVLAVVHGPQPVTWEVTVTRLSLRRDDAGLDLVGS